MTAAAGKTTVKLLLVEDNPLVLELFFVASNTFAT